MKKCIAAIAFLIVSIASSVASTMNIVVKLNPDDCAICNNNITRLYSYTPITKMVLLLKKEWSKDTVYLKRKFSLRQNDLSFIFSDSLYNAFGPEFSSKVMVLNGNTIQYKSTLKSLDFSVLDKLLSNDILPPASDSTTDTNPVSTEYLCGFSFSRRVKYFGSLNAMTVYDLLDERLYNLYDNFKVKDTFTITYQVLEHIYALHFGSKGKSMLRLTDSISREAPAAQPSISSFGNANGISYCLLTAMYFTTYGDVSTAHKFFTVVTFAKGQEAHFTPVYVPDDSLYGINEKRMQLVNRDRIVFSIIGPQKGEAYTIADCRLKNNKYEFAGYLPTKLPWQYSRSGLNYNSLELQSSYPYYGFTFSNTIYNLHNKDTFSVPLEDKSILDQLSLLKDVRNLAKGKALPFALWSITLDTDRHNLLIIHAEYSNIYFSKMDIKTHKLLSRVVFAQFGSIKIPIVDTKTRSVIAYNPEKGCFESIYKY